MSSPETITDPHGVDAVVREARAEGRVAIDLEFLWERTYAPIACLAQLATPVGVHLVDPIEGAPLGADRRAGLRPRRRRGHARALGRPHAAGHGLRRAPPGASPTSSSRAGFVGLGAGQGLGNLLERVLGVKLDKGERYTDWSRRPLSAAQLEYAAGDVIHLLALADELARRAAALGRTEWVAEEHERRYGPGAKLLPDPETAWRKVKGAGRLNGKDRAVLVSLAAWREREARPARQAHLVGRSPTAPWSRSPTAARPRGRRWRSERGLPDRIRGADADGAPRRAARGRERAAPAGRTAALAGAAAAAGRARTRSGRCW